MVLLLVSIQFMFLLFHCDGHLRFKESEYCNDAEHEAELTQRVENVTTADKEEKKKEAYHEANKPKDTGTQPQAA